MLIFIQKKEREKVTFEIRPVLTVDCAEAANFLYFSELLLFRSSSNVLLIYNVKEIVVDSEN